MWVGLRYLLCLMTGNFILVMDNNIYTNISSCSKRLLIPQHKKKKLSYITLRQLRQHYKYNNHVQLNSNKPLPKLVTSKNLKNSSKLTNLLFSMATNLFQINKFLLLTKIVYFDNNYYVS